MELTPMRYKDYTWPHNPEIYRAEYRRQVAVHKVPFGTYTLQDLGVTCRVLQGEGVFAGAGAYEQFQNLEEIFYQEGPGLLVHPVWRPVSAHFVTLWLIEKPLPDYVRYAFVFWEDPGAYRKGLTPVEDTGGSGAAGTPPAGGERAEYTVKRGDTLWGIAGRYGVALTELIAANPQIKNPNLIYPGDRVCIP